MKRITMLTLFLLVMFALSVSLAGTGLAQDPGCELLEVGRKGDVNFYITPLDQNGDPLGENGVFPFPGGSSFCEGYGSDCLVAPYEITSIPDNASFNDFWISYPVDDSQFILVDVRGKEGNPEAEKIIPPCDLGGPMTSCMHYQVQVTFNDSAVKQQFVLIFEPIAGNEDNTLGQGRGDFIGGLGNLDYICPGGILVPSTEEGVCVDEPGETKGRQEVEAFENILIRTTRSSNGCENYIEKCEPPDVDNDGIPDDDRIQGNRCGDRDELWEELTDLSEEYEESGPMVNGKEIVKCGKSQAIKGTKNPCQATCKLVKAENPGWIWQLIGGRWYKICGGWMKYTTNPDYPPKQLCLDPQTYRACTYDGACCWWKTGGTCGTLRP